MPIPICANEAAETASRNSAKDSKRIGEIIRVVIPSARSSLRPARINLCPWVGRKERQGDDTANEIDIHLDGQDIQYLLKERVQCRSGPGRSAKIRTTGMDSREISLNGRIAHKSHVWHPLVR
jgi:hypothetical protein